MNFSDLDVHQSTEAFLPKDIITAIQSVKAPSDEDVVKASPGVVTKAALSVTGFILDETLPSIPIDEGDSCVYIPAVTMLSYDLKHNPSLENDYDYICRVILLAKELNIQNTLSTTSKTVTSWHMKEFFRRLTDKDIILSSLLTLVYANSRYATSDTRDFRPLARLEREKQLNNRIHKLKDYSITILLRKFGLVGLVDLMYLIYGMTG